MDEELIPASLSEFGGADWKIERSKEGTRSDFGIGDFGPDLISGRGERWGKGRGGRGKREERSGGWFGGLVEGKERDGGVFI